MTDFLLLLILTSLWCFGFRTLFQEGFLFHSVGDWAWEKSEFLSKPLFQCPPCMASVHGFIAYYLFIPINKTIPFYHDLFMWVAFCVCLCGLNYIVMKVIDSDIENHNKL